MPQNSNAELDELEKLLERALDDDASLPAVAAQAAQAALDVIRTARAKIGPAGSPRELLQLLELADGQNPTEKPPRPRPTRRIIH